MRGGSTCNTEFETLTGESLTFLPAGAFPFESYIDVSLPSLVSCLASQGYSTTALHFEEGENWKRNRVYPLIGFQKFYIIDDFEEKETLRWRVTDAENYNQLIRLYEANKEKSSLYIM